MALITCPDCQRQVSQYAPACSHCGRPVQQRSEQPAPWRAPYPQAQPFATEKQNVQIAYGSWAASYLVGPLLFASVIFCYVKRDGARGTIMAAHYGWLIETFWLEMLAIVFGLVVFFGMMQVAEGLAAVALLL